MKLPDAAFPAEGKVFEEAPKPFVGLAGESRSGDANGQWFRILAAGGTNLVTLKPGMFATTALPINGANPPKPAERPPLRKDIPCETQQAPNLQSKPGPPPQQRRIDTSNPVYQKRLAKAQAVAVEWLREQLKYEGLSGHFTVADKPVSRALVERLAAQAKASQGAGK
jgi:hypothetical protein